jgi:hypothetical protein
MKHAFMLWEGCVMVDWTAQQPPQHVSRLRNAGDFVVEGACGQEGAFDLHPLARQLPSCMWL